jgi:hypothetical protein
MDALKARLAALLQNPKVRQALITGGAYAAGAHGGPWAAKGVRAYGPAALDLIAKLIGG